MLVSRGFIDKAGFAVPGKKGSKTLGLSGFVHVYIELIWINMLFPAGHDLTIDF